MFSYAQVPKKKFKLFWLLLSRKFFEMNYLKAAELMISEGHYLHALEYFIEYFNTIPRDLWDRRTEYAMIEILNSLENYLNNENSLENLTKCFLYALNWFPQNIRIHFMFGGMLLKNGEFELAEKYLLKAWRMVDKRIENQLIIEKNLLYVAWNIVPRWNYRWLNSLVIKSGYEKAIFKAVDAGYKDIVNLRSSCDHLSLYAGAHKLCSSILSFESNSVLQKRGRELIAKHCPHVKHHSLLITETNNKTPYFLKETRDLLITDMFDSGFFGHGILEALYHSFHILMQEEFKVIPSKVKFYLTGIFSDDLDNKFRLKNNIPMLKLEDECVTRMYENYIYDSEIYVWYKYEVLTETTEFLNVDLDDMNSVAYLLKGKWFKDVHLIGIKKGVVNCLILRYDIYLDNEIIISNDFLKTDNEVGFEHAIFYCRDLVPVKPNEKLIFEARINDEQFSFVFKYDENMLVNERVHKSDFTMNEDAITFLNDEKWVNSLVRICEKIIDDSKLYIADFSAFPLVGLLLAKRGHQVYYFFSDSQVLKFVGYLMQKNKIDASLVAFVAYYQFTNFLPNLKKLDYVFYEPVNQDGSLKESPLRNVAFKSLEPKIILGNFLVHFVLVYSSCLKNFNEIDLEKVEPYAGLTSLNEYSSCEHAFFSKVDHEAMSKTTTWRISKEKEKMFTVQTEKKGKINGIMVWYTLFGKGGVRFSTKESSNFSTYAFRFKERRVEIHDKIAIEGRYGGGNLLSLTPIFF